MKTIALFGGSFDPPHIGHESIVKALLNLDYIQKIVVMPTFLNPFKKDFKAPSKLRFEWLQKIFNKFENVEISDYEVAQNKKVPTIESVKYLLTRYEKIYLVIGADNLNSLETWYKFNELKSKVTFIVATRDDVEIPKDFIKLNVKADVSSTSLRENIDKAQLPKECAQEIYNYYKEKNE